MADSQIMEFLCTEMPVKMSLTRNLCLKKCSRISGDGDDERKEVTLEEAINLPQEVTFMSNATKNFY